MGPSAQLVVYCVLILGISLLGGWIPTRVRLTHTRLQVATSFVAGLMLGVGLLHLLPHAWHQLGSIDRAVRWFLGGFLLMFLVQRFFYFHHHDVPDEAPEHPRAGEHSHAAPRAVAPKSGRPHATLAEKSALKLSWMGAAFGLTLHTLINGVALAASVEADAGARVAAGLFGFGTFLVIFLHKPFDAMVITTLMAAGGWPKPARHLVNAGFALVIPIGAALFHLGAGTVSGESEIYVGSALAFAAGTFLCIATSDLLPELQFHGHDRIKLSLSLLAGLGLAVLIGVFESSGHDHHHHHHHHHDHEPRAPALELPSGG